MKLRLGLLLCLAGCDQASPEEDSRRSLATSEHQGDSIRATPDNVGVAPTDAVAPVSDDVKPDPRDGVGDPSPNEDDDTDAANVVDPTPTPKPTEDPTRPSPPRPPQFMTIDEGFAWLSASPPRVGSRFSVSVKEAKSTSERDLAALLTSATMVLQVKVQNAALRTGSEPCGAFNQIYDGNGALIGGYDMLCRENSRFGLRPCDFVTETFIGQRDFADFPGSFGVRIVCENRSGARDQLSVGTYDSRLRQRVVHEIWFHKDSTEPRRKVFHGRRACEERVNGAADYETCVSNGLATVTLVSVAKAPDLATSLPLSSPPTLRGRFTLGGGVLMPGTYTRRASCTVDPTIEGPVALFLGTMDAYLSTAKDARTTWVNAGTMATPSVLGLTGGFGGMFSNMDWTRRSLGAPSVAVTKVSEHFYKLELGGAVSLMNGPNSGNRLLRATLSMPDPVYCFAPRQQRATLDLQYLED